jgi:hypothetical protein
VRAPESTTAWQSRSAANREAGKATSTAREPLSGTSSAPPSRQAALQAYVDGSPRITAQRSRLQSAFDPGLPSASAPPVQRKVGFEYEMTDINTRRRNYFGNGSHAHEKGRVLRQFPGFQLTADVDVAGASQLEVIIKEIDETDANEVLTLVNNTAPAAVAAINAIANGAANWTRADQLAGVGGSRFDEYRFMGNGAANIFGQLQMTGGVDPAKLLNHLSGMQAQNYLGTLNPVPGANLDDDAARGTLAPYEPVAGGIGLAVGPHAAVAVNAAAALNVLTQAARDHLAGIVALMATIPVTARSQAGILPYAKSAAGAHLARTDFSRMLQKLPNATKAALTAGDMRQIVLATINAAVPGGGVVIGDPVFPAGAVGGGAPNLDALTIQTWVNDALPTVGFFGGYNKGKDRLTKKHFPGGKAEKAQMESLGSYGKKLDPGDFPILEFRTLTNVLIGELTEQLRRLLAFINH